MVLIVWQGIISIHQKTFLEALAKQPRVSKVIMVVEQEISPYRKNMGWEVPVIENVEIIRSPSESEIKGIFATYKDAVHLLGGIRVGKMMTQAFDAGAAVGAKMGSLSEPYNKDGWKGMLRTLKYKYQSFRYYKHMSFFLAVGKEGVATYTGLGFDARYVYPWAYFINVPLAHKPASPVPARKRIIYGGRLEPGKGIYNFVSLLAQSPKEKYTLDIFGSGPDEGKIKELVAAMHLEGTIRFQPFMPYNEMVQQYKNYDWVVLPSSAKDGWGVVISEGMLNGLKAICSSICGVSWAIKDDFNGIVFDWAQQGSAAKAIAKMLTDDNFADSAAISTWAKGAISADAGAEYYLKIIDATFNGKEKPAVPWVHD